MMQEESSVEEKDISRAVIKRLPRYYRYLGELMEDGVERISSNELSGRMKVTASQIRQDLNNFGGFGQQGYGYNVKYLHSEIAKILGLDRTHNMIIVGAGNLGQALANYTQFEKQGFKIVGWKIFLILMYMNLITPVLFLQKKQTSYVLLPVLTEKFPVFEKVAAIAGI